MISIDKTLDYLTRIGPGIVTLILLIKNWGIKDKIQEVHVSVDGRIGQLIASKDELRQIAVAEATSVAHAAGLQQGQAQAALVVQPPEPTP